MKDMNIKKCNVYEGFGNLFFNDRSDTIYAQERSVMGKNAWINALCL
jgi:hypothetical protein